MFEVGKHYRGKNGPRKIEVLYVGKTASFVLTSDGTEELFPNEYFESWEEYTPPVMHTQELYLKHNVHGGFMLRDDASNFTEAPGTRTLGKIRLTWTEGVTPEAEIL